MQLRVSSSLTINVAGAEATERIVEFEQGLVHIVCSSQLAATERYTSCNAPSCPPPPMITVGPVYPSPCYLQTASVPPSQQLGSAHMYPPSPISPAWATHSEPPPVPPFPPPLRYEPCRRALPLHHIHSSRLLQLPLGQARLHQIFPTRLQVTPANINQVPSTHLHQAASAVLYPAASARASAHILQVPSAQIHMTQLQHVTSAPAQHHHHLCPQQLRYTPQPLHAAARPLLQCQPCVPPPFRRVHGLQLSTQHAQQQLVSRSPAVARLHMQCQHPQRSHNCEPSFTHTQLSHTNPACVPQYRQVQQQSHTQLATMPTTLEMQTLQADYEEPEKLDFKNPGMPLQMPYVMASSDSITSGSEKACHAAGVVSVGEAEWEGGGQLDIDLLGGEEEVETQGMYPPTGLHPGEVKDLEDYQDFAAKLKSHREELGYSQAHVIQQVGLRYGIALPPDSVAEFELARVSLEDARRLRPTLEQWIRDTAKAAGISIEESAASSVVTVHSQERRRRTVTTAVVREHLEREFLRKKKPSQAEMSEMAQHLNVEKEYVRIWFCNRRQRQKKRDTRAEHVADIATTTITVPSPSHDITMEIPVEGQARPMISSVPAVYIMEERKEVSS